jgi:heme ABC exporter ATP-binding subunit CcmA
MQWFDTMPMDVRFSQTTESWEPSDGPAARETAIEARRLTFDRAGQWVLDEINLSVAAGEIVAVLGANGAGKTTLLRCLAGLAQPTSGDVRWFGASPRRRPALRRLIGMVAHQDWVYGELTPRENLLFCAQMHGMDQASSRVEHLLSQADLLAHANKATHQLSCGMRRRLAVCRALVNDPPILVLDEPFSGLDEVSREWLKRLLAESRAQSRAICLTTHGRELAKSLADRCFELAAGKLRPIYIARPQALAWEAAA